MHTENVSVFLSKGTELLVKATGDRMMTDKIKTFIS